MASQEHGPVVFCMWCGKTYEEHGAPIPGGVVARMPCLGLKSGFTPRPATTKAPPDLSRTVRQLRESIAAGERVAYLRGLGEGIAGGSRDERDACAELVRAKGCVCIQLHAFLGESTGIRLSQVSQIDSVVDIHDPRCPIAIADSIAKRGA